VQGSWSQTPGNLFGWRKCWHLQSQGTYLDNKWARFSFQLSLPTKWNGVEESISIFIHFLFFSNWAWYLCIGRYYQKGHFHLQRIYLHIRKCSTMHDNIKRGIWAFRMLHRVWKHLHTNICMHYSQIKQKPHTKKHVGKRDIFSADLHSM
jgi:hypothetical protein